MTQEININPMPTGQSSPAARTRMMVSDLTIAEQFCMVAADMRSILSAMKTSVELQRQMVEAFDSYSAKLDATMTGIDSAVNKIDDLITETTGNVDQLKTNTETLSNALVEFANKLP
jgi:methyl-accepting chemotaxis protein